MQPLFTLADLVPLQLRFSGCCRSLGARVSQDQLTHAFGDLVNQYTQPRPRPYHNLRHVHACLAVLDQFSAEIADSRVVEFALWYHDAVYDAQRSDNEEMSATLAVETARSLGLHPDHAPTIERLILATRHAAPPTADDERWIVDIDLSILAAAPSEYDAYAEAIRREYSFVEDAAFREGRTAFLSKLLAQPQIFQTATAQSRFESTARLNIHRERSRLSSGGAP